MITRILNAKLCSNVPKPFKIKSNRNFCISYLDTCVRTFNKTLKKGQ